MEDVFKKIEQLTLAHDKISPEIIKKKNIKLGLRNPDGTGVVVGITQKGRVVGYEKDEKKDGSYEIRPAHGDLFYCGYSVPKLVNEFIAQKRFGYEEIVYLLLTGELPNKTDLDRFTAALAKKRFLTRNDKRIIMQEVENQNQMYALHSVISHLSRCDKHPDSIAIEDVSRQCLNLIAKAPTIVAYNYNFLKYNKGWDLNMLKPKNELSIAENFLYMLRGEVPDEFEARLFDIALILHAEHGGGNNSTFTVRTVSSSGANTYMAIAAGIASLSGHLHGGANESVMKMMSSIKKEVKDWSSETEIKKHLTKMLDKKTGDGTGKIFGLGHAVYTMSDPRAVILKEMAREYAERKGATNEFHLFENVEKIGSALLTERKKAQINANVDFYSGFVYKLMGIPKELFTPIFAMSRIAGWSAHRLEQIVQGKIMRPAYISASNDEKSYIPLSDRD